MSDVDLDKYRKHIAHFDLPEDKKSELLRIVWRIMQSFVDRAFGDDPVQQVRRGLEDNSPEKHASDAWPVIEWENEKTPDNKKDLTGAFRGKSGTPGEKDS
jgi:hypothetical protein